MSRSRVRSRWLNCPHRAESSSKFPPSPLVVCFLPVPREPAAVLARAMDLNGLCTSVSTWVELQAESTALLLAEVEESRLQLCAGLDAADADFAAAAATAARATLEGCAGSESPPRAPVGFMPSTPVSPIATPRKALQFTTPRRRPQAVDDEDPLPPVSEKLKRATQLLRTPPPLCTVGCDLSAETVDGPPPDVVPPPETIADPAPELSNGPPTRKAALGGFPAIETVLAARQRRLGAGSSAGSGAGAGAACSRPSPPAAPCLFKRSPPRSPPRAGESGDGDGDGGGGGGGGGGSSSRSQPLDATLGSPAPAGGGGASEVAVAGLRRLLLRSCFDGWTAHPQAAEELTSFARRRREAALAAAVRSLSAHAVRSHAAARWHRLRRAWATARAYLSVRSARRGSRALISAGSRHHDGRRAKCAVEAWSRSAAWSRGVTAAAEATRAAARCSLQCRGWDAWLTWLRRVRRWRRRNARRAEDNGGESRRHLPCMRGFDARAVFVEEGSAGVVSAYRRRRIAAVALCQWAAATFAAAEAEPEAMPEAA